MRLGLTAPLTVALYQPDIPQNTGTILRMCACLGLAAAIIEPAGFSASNKRFRRAGMDYLAHVEIVRFPYWAAFEEWRHALTTKARLDWRDLRKTKWYDECRRKRSL
jgi:tRNA (cytidine/uridine-2'-O-)-methyltransferase